MPSASKILGDLVSSAGAISVTSGVANTAITGTITTAQIADNAITTDKVAASAIVTADIADANVTAAKLANTAVTAGTYGGSSNSALITVDSQGRITAASNVAASAGGLGGTTVFTSSGTFTIPAGKTVVKVTVIGGGGGGGGGADIGCGFGLGSGGGGGGSAIKYLTGLTPGNTLTVTIGAAGTAGSSAPGNGGAGGTSSVASGTQSITTISATGGSGGFAASSGQGAAVNGGSGSNGDVNIVGGCSSALIYRTNDVAGFSGGTTIYEGVKVPVFNGVAPEGSNGTGGAGGASNNGSVNRAGGAGGAGLVIFEY